MTTNVKVAAHCSADKEVQVLVNGQIERILQDGETFDGVVYDDRIIQVQEVVKVIG